MARDQAQKANEFKTKLLANVSHDLRTPLSAILGYTDMLQQGVYGPLTATQQTVTGKIIECVHHLTSMVTELLDQAKLEADTLSLTVAPFVPKMLIERTQAPFQILAETKGLCFTTEIATDVPAPLWGDVERLQQILNNLVGNALKFTDQGAVQVRIYRPDETHWALLVSDTGPGIPVEAQASIFEPFWQVNGSMTRRHGGSGLGLSIVKHLTTLMGGQITVNSELGRGSTFTVLLPLTPFQEKPT